MGKFNAFAIIGVLLFSIAGCSSRADRAARYNDSIVRKQHSVIVSFEKMDSIFSDSVASKETIEFHYMELQKNIKIILLALDSIGPFQSDPSLQLAAKNLFQTYERIVDKDYRSLVGIKLLSADQITPQIADSSLAIQSRVHILSSQAQDEFMATQIEFGKKFNLEFH